MTSPDPRDLITVEELAKGIDDDEIAIDVAGPVQVNVRRITIAPGGSTGGHHHPGQLITVVIHGTLTHYAPTHPGGVKTFSQGDAVLEGSGYVHEGRNEGTEPVVLLATYLTPKGEPLAEAD